MHTDKQAKNIHKSYCKTVLAEHGELTKDLFDKINAGDEATIRDSTNKEIILSQVDGIQEVLDSLSDILNA